MGSVLSPDVLIVGAGMAGATAATLLARQGIKVTVVDRWAQCPPCFKAEKIEPDQADLLRKFRMMDTVRPVITHIKEVLRVQDGRVIRRLFDEQYGMFYHDIVNIVRQGWPADVEFLADRMQDIKPHPESPEVTLASGTVIKPRLVVISCGTGADTRSKLGIKQRMIQLEQAWGAGYNIARKDGKPFDFDSITYYPTGSKSHTAFLTLFRIGDLMRANMYTYWSNSGQQVKDFLKTPVETTEAALPGVTGFIGDYEVTSKIESARVDLYTTDSPKIPGVVLLGDAFQSVCPVTGTGLSKVLTDVDVLCTECVPRWLDSPGMAVEKLVSYYQNPHKIAVDRHSIAGGQYVRHLSIDNTFAWKMRRMQWTLDNRVSDVFESFAQPRRAMA